jgi:NAD(P)-dependent dehydrogenase (short-subunit alcohol dehydrogenase family)
MSFELAGRRVFLTGATGFIGEHIARRLHNDGAHVLALERTPGKGDGLAAAGIEIVRGDMNDRDIFSATMSKPLAIWRRPAPTRALSGLSTSAASPFTVASMLIAIQMKRCQ